MEKTSLKIKAMYNSMSRSDKQIADWINKNPGKIISLSIVDLSEECGCSEATIVRFAKKLGLSGYQELKISLASEGSSLPINSNISQNDAPFDIYQKICTDVYLSFEKTKKSLDPKNFEMACKKIMSADKIVVFGLGNSASVAMDASHKLLRAGLNSVAYNDNHMQVIAASHLSKNDVAIAISHSGSSKDIVDAIKLAREHGATTIAITNAGKSELLKCTDIPLFTSADETKYSILALNSRIVQLAIIDAIYHYIVLNNSDKALESIKETERSLLNKKY